MLPRLVARFGFVGGEVHLPDRRARRRVQALGQHRVFGLRVELRVQQLVELRRLHTKHCFALVDHAFFLHLDRHAQRGGSSALADTSLQHEQPALLDRELDVAHVAEVLLELVHHLEQARVRIGELVGHVGQRFGDADAGDDVFALRVLEEVAVRRVLARRRVARERDTSSGIVTLVAEHHRLHVDRGSEVVGDPLETAVIARALAVPRLEHRFDRVAKLRQRIVRELDATSRAARSP